jgi:hypothetical protein
MAFLSADGADGEEEKEEVEKRRKGDDDGGGPSMTAGHSRRTHIPSWLDATQVDTQVEATDMLRIEYE